MRLTAVISGEAIRFEGSRTVHIQGLPEGVEIKSAAIALTPVAAPGRPVFEEVLTFTGNVGDYGMAQVPKLGSVEVDFHTRRTLSAVRGINLNSSHLVVNLGGGVFMDINQRGGIASPEDADTPYTLPPSNALPGLTVNSFRLNEPVVAGVDPTRLSVTQVTVQTLPTNVSLALGELPPFWVQPGEIASAVTTSDFSDMLQLFLQEAEVSDGYYHLPLVLNSDSLTRLDVVVDIEYVRRQSALPAGVDEVILPYGFDNAAQAGSAQVQVTMPVGAEVTGATVQVLGAFDESRIVFGPIGPINPVAAVPIIGGQSQAQPIVLSTDTPATAIDLLLSSTSRAAVLDLNLMADVGGKPFADPLLSAPVPLELDRDLAPNPTWISARLPQEFQFSAGTRYWLVIQARQGDAAWHSQTAVAGEELQHSTSSGLSWRVSQVEGVTGSLAGFFRLRHTPTQYEMPLSVQVGEGETAVPVSLDRFQPLGRIDFTIDFPEFAAAINEVAKRSSIVTCARGEQLQNGDYARWSTVGESFGPLQNVRSMTGVSNYTIAPNGEWAVVGTETGNAGIMILPLHELLEVSIPSPISRQHIAISQNSLRIYAITQAAESAQLLHVIDASTFEPLGVPVSLPWPPVSCIALSPNGLTLYVGSSEISPPRGAIYAVETAVLVQLLAEDGSVNIEDALVIINSDEDPDFIPLEPDILPVSMAVTPNGKSLFVAAEEETNEGVDPSGWVYAFDTNTHQPLLATPIFSGIDPADLAIVPDGRRVLVANAGEDSITVIDATRLLMGPKINLVNPVDGSLEPVAIEIEPNGQRAFVANRATASVSVIDLVSLEVRGPVTVSDPDFGENMDLAVTPTGDRLYIALQSPYPSDISGLRFFPLGRQHPDNWTLSTGFVMPVPFTDPFHLTAVLGPMTEEERKTPPARTSALSQAVAVVGGCTYDFSFWGLTSSLEAVAEVIWRGGACTVQRTDRIPIQVFESEERRQNREIARRVEVASGGSFSTMASISRNSFDVNATLAQILPELLFHRVRLVAPVGATQAEIRFLVPPEHKAIVDTVSFQATSDTIANGDLMLVQNRELVGWQVSPASVTGVTLNTAESGEVELTNSEAVPISLRQSFEVTGGQPFVLLLRGNIVSQLVGGTPEVKLDWLDTADNAVGTTSLPILTGRQEHQLAATVPAEAAGAELSLVSPAGTTLGVRQISFVPVELVTVPIHFLAQAPGNLTVTGFDVAYDVGEVATTPKPPEGLCPPTPPGRGMDGKGGCCVWCSSPCGPCSDDTPAVDSAPGPVATTRSLHASAPRRRAAIAARPALVNAPVAITVPTPPEILEMEPAIAPLLTATAKEWAARAPELAAMTVPLDSISGIAEGRMRVLAEIGVDSIPRLAAAAPESVAGALQGVTLPMAESFVAKAQVISADVAALPAPLVSCVMPTSNRHPFIKMSIEYFIRQDYPNRELIILDDGSEPAADLVPDDNRIRYVRLETRMSVGAKRNLGGQKARGPIIACWDDDVWMTPWRLSYQVAALIEFGADVCGLDNQLHYDPFTRKAYHSVRLPGPLPWMPGSTFCYTKAFWQTNPFPDMQLGADIRFLRQKPKAKIVPLQAVDWMVDIIHQTNVSPKPTTSPLWFPYDFAKIQELLGSDMAFYTELAASG